LVLRRSWTDRYQGCGDAEALPAQRIIVIIVIAGLDRATQYSRDFSVKTLTCLRPPAISG
jgi:hypothetical protein